MGVGARGERLPPSQAGLPLLGYRLDRLGLCLCQCILISLVSLYDMRHQLRYTLPALQLSPRAECNSEVGVEAAGGGWQGTEKVGGGWHRCREQTSRRSIML